jgi:putative transcriptional regulator
LRSGPTHGYFNVMDPQNSTRVEEGESFLEGKLLIALPGMTDKRFAQTVIFMCGHSATGAMGIVINKPIPDLSFAQLMEHLKISTDSDVTPDYPILYGGPVESGRGFVLHSGDYQASDSLPVSEEISLTATVDVLRDMAAGKGPKRVLFALGYAGWAPGQIENEFHENGWLHCDADPALVFGTQPDALWRTALARLGVGPSGLVADMGRA